MFSEFKLKDKIILRNKAVLAPMTTWSSNPPNISWGKDGFDGVEKKFRNLCNL